MTTTDDRPTVTCPSWCGHAPHALEEHYSEPVYTPATAGSPKEHDSLRGVSFPMVGVCVVYAPMEGDPAPFVTLHITGAGLDVDVNLRVDQAQAVAREIARAVRVAAG